MTERGLTYARHDSCPGISTIRDLKFEAVTQQPSSHTCVQGARRVRPACLMHGSPHRQRQLHLLRPRRVRAIRCGSASTAHALGQATLACLHARFACLHARLHSQPAAPAHASRAHPHPTHIPMHACPQDSFLLVDTLQQDVATWSAFHTSAPL